ncbi:MAG: insulinase family protein [Burkholderiales bacterium]|nr:insulinase family protein [Flavobacterium sp.]
MQAQDRSQPKPGPAPTINIGKPQSFELQNGLKVMVVENHKLPRVSYNLTLDNTPYLEGSKKGVAELTGRLMGSGTTKMSKELFNEEVDFLGADISFNNNGAYAGGLSKYANRILELMADGALNSVFTQKEFDKEKSKLIEALKAEEKSVPAVARRVENILSYGKNHPSGEYLSETSINTVTLADVNSNYNTYFVPANAYLIVIGDVKFDEIKTQVETLFDPWSKATSPNLSYSTPKDVQYTQLNVVDMPNAVQSEISVINISNLKMTDKDYFATIVANQLLGGDFNSYLNMNLREKHAWTYGAESQIRGSKYTSRFIAFSQVRNAVTDSAVVEFLKEIKRIRTEKVSDDVLKNVKAGYVGNFVMQIQKPQTIAGYALRIKTQGLPADFYENYIKNINAVTADDILRVANQYFLNDKARITIVGKGSEIIPALEKLKIPIFYFDKFGNAVEKPVYKAVIPAGITAKSVLNNYIKTVGGEKALQEVKSIVTISSGTIQGTPVELISKTSSENKQFREIKAMGMSMMKQVVNEKGAYAIQQGQRKEITGDDLNEMKSAALPFPELAISKKETATLQGIENFNGSDAYVIKDGKLTLYYDVNSGLKVAESRTSEMGGRPVTQTIAFDDYRLVKGIKIPYHYVLNVGIEIDLTTTDVKINEGVLDADFQ